MNLDPKQRVMWIRKGNEAFNRGDYRLAREYFIKANYKDGLIRLGDYYMYKKRLPLLAYGYYKKAGAKEKIEDIHRRMILALGTWIGEDKIKPESLKKLKGSSNRLETTIQVQVHPRLLETAKAIINKYENSDRSS